MKLSELAPKNFTKSNLDHNPPSQVEGLERILKKQRSQLQQVVSSSPSLLRSTSLPVDLTTLEDLSFDIKFEFSLLRTKSESSLVEIVYDPIKIEFSAPSLDSSSEIYRKVFSPSSQTSKIG